jgi:hypothetical protein
MSSIPYTPLVNRVADTNVDAVIVPRTTFTTWATPNARVPHDRMTTPPPPQLVIKTFIHIKDDVIELVSRTPLSKTFQHSINANVDDQRKNQIRRYLEDTIEQLSIHSAVESDHELCDDDITAKLVKLLKDKVYKFHGFVGGNDNGGRAIQCNQRCLQVIYNDNITKYHGRNNIPAIQFTFTVKIKSDKSVQPSWQGPSSVPPNHASPEPMETIGSSPPSSHKCFNKSNNNNQQQQQQQWRQRTLKKAVNQGATLPPHDTIQDMSTGLPPDVAVPNNKKRQRRHTSTTSNASSELTIVIYGDDENSTDEKAVDPQPHSQNTRFKHDKR